MRWQFPAYACLALALLAAPARAELSSADISVSGTGPDAATLIEEMSWCMGAAIGLTAFDAELRAEADTFAPEYRRIIENQLGPVAAPHEFYLYRQKLRAAVSDGPTPADLLRQSEAGRAAMRSRVHGTARVMDYTSKGGEMSVRCSVKTGETVVETLARKEAGGRFSGEVDARIAALFAGRGEDAMTQGDIAALFAILREGGFSENERALLRDMVLGPGVPVSGGSVTATSPPLEQREHLVLASIAAPVDYNELWLASPKLTGAFIDIAGVSEDLTYKPMQDFVSRRANEAWQMSSITNQYAPFRNFVADVREMSARLETPEQGAALRALSFKAIRAVDAAYDDVIGDYLYNEIRNPLEAGETAP